MSHTPGPWHVFAAVDREGGIGIEVDGYRVATAHMRLDTIERGDGVGQQRANASLIAAAPDLLAALKELIYQSHEWDTLTLGSRTGYDQAIDMANAAIAKAEGREP